MMHNLTVSCLVAAYLAANVYTIVKVRVFDLYCHGATPVRSIAVPYTGNTLASAGVFNYVACYMRLRLQMPSTERQGG